MSVSPEGRVVWWGTARSRRRRGPHGSEPRAASITNRSARLARCAMNTGRGAMAERPRDAAWRGRVLRTLCRKYASPRPELRLRTRRTDVWRGAREWFAAATPLMRSQAIVRKRECLWSAVCSRRIRRVDQTRDDGVPCATALPREITHPMRGPDLGSQCRRGEGEPTPTTTCRGWGVKGSARGQERRVLPKGANPETIYCATAGIAPMRPISIVPV